MGEVVRPFPSAAKYQTILDANTGIAQPQEPALRILPGPSTNITVNTSDVAGVETDETIDVNIATGNSETAIRDALGFGGSLLAIPAIDHGHPLLLNVKAKSAAYPMVNSDLAIMATGGAGGITITLPANPAVGTLVFVKKVDTGAGAVTVAGSGAATIEGVASLSLAAQWNSILLLARAALSWVKIAST